MDIKVEGFEIGYKQWIGKYAFALCEQGWDISVNVYQAKEGYYVAEPDTLIRHPCDGSVDDSSEVESSVENVIIAVLEKFKRDLNKHYPNGAPPEAFVNREVASLAYDINPPNSVEAHGKWHKEKLRRNVKAGPYLEFQLEHEGTYTHWHDESLFVGTYVFDCASETFCRNGRDFEKYGLNLFSLAELPALREKIEARINFLNKITSLSEFSEQVQNFIYWSWISEQATWHELRDAVIELLTEVDKLIVQGQKENRALFVLGY